MQLSSLVLSATALLVHTAWGFNIHCPELDRFGYNLASVHTDGETGETSVGFFLGNKERLVDIEVDFSGNLRGDFVFRWMASGEWLLTQTDGSSIKPSDIIRPFRVGSQSELLYTGEAGGVWNVCDYPEIGGYELILSRDPITRDGCIGNVALLTTGR